MFAIIDGNEIGDRDALHDALARQLALPDWYGRNLDALYDCLTDLREPSEIRLTNTAALFDHLGGYAGRFLAALHDACGENPRLRLAE